MIKIFVYKGVWQKKQSSIHFYPQKINFAENARSFYNQLCKENVPLDYLSNLEYSILGLGDTNYSQFCNGPRTLHKRLQSLGAKTFYEPGWADDGVG